MGCGKNMGKTLCSPPAAARDLPIPTIPEHRKHFTPVHCLYGGDVLYQTALLSGLALAVIFVNGWTDAPNAIATVMASGTLSFRRAAALAALCDLAGVLVMSLLCPTVAETVFSMADFGGNTEDALLAIQAALLAIVLWAVLAWRFGIPTSESHALIAGLTGAAMALQNSLSAVNATAWTKVLAGLVLSTLCGALAGRWTVGRPFLRALSPRGLRRGQILCAGTMAFLHGTQDGQKFLALLLLTRSLSQGREAHEFSVSPASALICALVMAAGVACGGRRIIDTVSRTMAPDPRQGLAADLAGGGCLLATSLLGLPVSTTHTKISAILGAGSGLRDPSRTGTAFRIVLTWLATFPCCGLLAWALTRLMIL